MEELDSLFVLYSDDVIILAGDFNANPGVSVTDFHLPPNEQGIIFNRYLDKWDYVSVHLLPSLNPSGDYLTHESEAHGSESEAHGSESEAHGSESEAHGSESETHGSFSIIDHFVGTKYFLPKFVSATVGIDHPLSSSDHLPIISSMILHFRSSTSPIPSHQTSTFPIINWSKCDDFSCDQYARLVECLLPNIPSTLSVQSIESSVTNITHSLIFSATKFLPIIKHRRRNWSLKLRELHSTMKAADRLRIRAGRSSIPSDSFRLSYNTAKTSFRREFRKFKRQEQDEFYNSLDLSDWNIYRHIRQKKGKLFPGTNILNVAEASFEVSRIHDGWASYFSGLASPDTQSFSQSHSTSVETRLLSILLSLQGVDLPPISIIPDIWLSMPLNLFPEKKLWGQMGYLLNTLLVVQFYLWRRF